jgi:uncharacterized integral membrane protein
MKVNVEILILVIILIFISILTYEVSFNLVQFNKDVKTYIKSQGGVPHE